MRTYIIRRLLLIVPTMLLVSLLVFFPIRFLPGDVMQLMVAEHTTSFYQARVTVEEAMEMIRKDLGLDVPIHIQYGRWLGVLSNGEGKFEGLLQGSLGISLWSHRPVRESGKV